MAVRPAIDRSAVVAGGLVAFGVAAATILAWQVLDAVADVGDSAVLFVFYLVVVAGWVVGGRIAARRAPHAPFTHGALAGLVSFAPILVLGVVLALARGDDVPVVEMVFNAMVAASAGIFGGLLAGRAP